MGRVTIRGLILPLRMKQLTIDLNADLGEGYPFDEALMQVVTSANICSGAYIIEDTPVRKAIAHAANAEVQIGIHIGYPDVEGLGRRSAFLSPKTFQSALQRQVDHFLELALAEAATIRYLKPHGALYHDLIPESALWDILLRTCETHQWPVLHLAQSALLEVAATVAGAVHEGFVDRRYASPDALVDRSIEGAVMIDPEEVLAQAVSLAMGNVVLADGTKELVKAQSLCLHGDTAGALDLGKHVRSGLQEANVTITPFG